MKSRREFFERSSHGRRGAGFVRRGGKAGVGWKHEHATNGKSKVVVARDAALHGTGAQPDEQRVMDLLDSAMAAYTGRDKPVEAWKSIVPACSRRTK